MARPKKFSKLNETFNLTDDSTEIKPTTVSLEPTEIKTPLDVNKDYIYSRESYYDIIEKGRDAIDRALDLAQELDNPRSYEVVGHLIKTVSDAADKLIDLQKKMKDIGKESSQKGPSTVTNNVVFTGTTAEALKMIKQQLKGE